MGENLVLFRGSQQFFKGGQRIMLEKVRDKQTEGKSGMDSEIQKQSKKRQETRSFSICRISLLFIQVAETAVTLPSVQQYTT